ncbi:hypothetical protein BJX68DRAFT_279566 [Aspergillus pseudodeflectus]|uniref:Zn(2)-C6 fungal-type domain-containing protein n=1 Tax=Aspergillus pseudodeflectus TaxID=176178 RepID=A0ABR4KWB9_9EURO
MLEPDHTLPSRPKKRYSRRARTGCETCRIRRVKCDETPGSCRNCTSTGRKCEGYSMTRLPRWRNRNSNRNQPGLGLGLVEADLGAALAGKTSDERRCFHIFQNQTIPMFVSLFDSADIWHVVLQMCQSDPSVCYAVVAFSALHEGTLVRQGYLRSPDNAFRDFALKQHGKALGSLARRLGSNDPEMRSVALVCCVVFVLFELLNNNYSGIIVHIQNGVNILANAKGATARASVISGAVHPSCPRNSSGFEVALRRTFAHIDVHSSPFEWARLAPSVDQHFANVIDLDSCPVWFDSLNGARETLDPLINNVFALWRLAQPILRTRYSDHDPSYHNLMAEQPKMRMYLSRHVAAFDTFLALHHPPLATPRELRSRDVIRLHHLVLYINVEACTSLSEMIFDNFPREWSEAVDLADDIITSYITEFGANLPNLVIDLGVSLPLSWISLKCRDFTLRQRAIDLLRLWPHSEGLHNTTLLMNLGQAACDVEAEALDPVTGVVPEEGRIRTVDIQIDQEKGRGMCGAGSDSSRNRGPDIA